ncbi:MAG: transposase [Treponema sp.]|jgi:REP element-mobilizing transposase RayT|nr:transposase [Treponema sp.]
MNQRIPKPGNVSIIMYHIVCPAKYRRVVITEEVDKKLKEICLEIEKRYEIKFLEIGTEKDYVQFLTARKLFEACPEVKKSLWGGELWTRGYYIGTVGEHGDEETIARYVRNQGRKPEEYEQIYENKQ